MDPLRPLCSRVPSLCLYPCPSGRSLSCCPRDLPLREADMVLPSLSTSRGLLPRRGPPTGPLLPSDLLLPRGLPTGLLLPSPSTSPGRHRPSRSTSPGLLPRSPSTSRRSPNTSLPASPSTSRRRPRSPSTSHPAGPSTSRSPAAPSRSTSPLPGLLRALTARRRRLPHHRPRPSTLPPRRCSRPTAEDPSPPPATTPGPRLSPTCPRSPALTSPARRTS